MFPKARDPRQEEGEKSCRHPLLKETGVKPPLGNRGVARRALRMLRAATRSRAGDPRGAVGLVAAQRRVYLTLKAHSWPSGRV